jgi:DNA polymerase-3 subunit gamma/tau
MRDALSILDQAIASAESGLSEASVRQLVGVAPSGALEQIMQAVARGSGQQLLEKVDRLLTEGQNPAHLARQLVRFLRNITVAKVAGADSRLLQVSSEERARVARVAELFSEEDLARHLEIMLRTHGELGYRGEQRFRLELGLLKLAHAQRLVPLEELLSGLEANPGVPPAKLARAAEAKKSEPSAGTRTLVSPFAADSVRKGTPRSELSKEPAQTTIRSAPALNSTPAARGAAAPAVAVQPAEQPDSQPGFVTEEVRAAVILALTQSEKNLLVSMLEAAEWKLERSQLTISIEASSSLVEMSVDADAAKMITASASRVLGRAVKVQIVPAENQGASRLKPAPSLTNGTSRARAEQEPVVRRMKEKFGAEIRTVIDYRNR